MCHYRIVFPQGSSEFDQIIVTLKSSIATKVFLTETETFRSSKYTEYEMQLSANYVINWPNEAFILVVTEGFVLADFSISYQFWDRDPEEVIANMTIEERDEYLNTKTTVEEGDVDETDTFWFFVSGGILGAIIICCLIYCMIVVKKRNDVMVAKVEKMSAEQLAEKDYIPEEERNDDFYVS